MQEATYDLKLDKKLISHRSNKSFEGLKNHRDCKSPTTLSREILTPNRARSKPTITRSSRNLEKFINEQDKSQKKLMEVGTKQLLSTPSQIQQRKQSARSGGTFRSRKGGKTFSYQTMTSRANKKAISISKMTEENSIMN